MPRLHYALAALGTLCSPAIAADCVALVEHYRTKQAEGSASELPDAFRGWTASFPRHFSFIDDTRTHSTDLVCDESGQLHSFVFHGCGRKRT
jgi:hypothetical protein